MIILLTHEARVVGACAQDCAFSDHEVDYVEVLLSTRHHNHDVRIEQAFALA